MRKLWQTRKVKTTGVSIDEIAQANVEEGSLNAYMCIQGRERAKKLVTRCLVTKWMNSSSFSERYTRIVDFEDTQHCWHLS